MYQVRSPRWTGYVEVGDGHRLYVEEHGAENGIPAVLLHGGPGSGFRPGQAAFFDPDRYRLVMFDQRGAGRSEPRGSTAHNTTGHLLADLERLRTHLHVDRWVVAGGSWGATLALVYAQQHADRVLALVLRGVFLARAEDRDWFFGPRGAARLFPVQYAAFVAGLSAAERADVVGAYHGRLNAGDAAVRRGAAHAWHAWEACVTEAVAAGEGPATRPDPAVLEQRAAIACHYARHDFFLPPALGALSGASALHGIPGLILHGQLDLVCPAEGAVLLHRAWPQSRLSILGHCGHSASETAMSAAMVAALDGTAANLAD